MEILLERTAGMEKRPSGAQSIERAFEILRIISGNSSQGMRLKEIAAEAGLSAPTTHRILQTLQRKGAIERFRDKHHYVIGSELTLLGLSSTLREFRERAAPSLRMLSNEVGDAVFLSVRSGLDTVCIDRKIGNFPVQVLSIEIGSRRPLGISANGVAILSRTPKAEADSIIQSNAERLKAYGASLSTIKERVSRSRNNGFVVIRKAIVKDTSAIAFPVYDVVGRPIAAIGSVAISSRHPKHRISQLLETMRVASKEISEELAKPPPLGW